MLRHRIHPLLRSHLAFTLVIRSLRSHLVHHEHTRNEDKLIVTWQCFKLCKLWSQEAGQASARLSCTLQIQTHHPPTWNSRKFFSDSFQASFDKVVLHWEHGIHRTKWLYSKHMCFVCMGSLSKPACLNS